MADIDGRDKGPVCESKQTRLGQGFARTTPAQPSPVNRVRQSRVGAGKARELHADKLTAHRATSAARDAKNPCGLLSAVEKESGLKVEIIHFRRTGGRVGFSRSDIGPATCLAGVVVARCRWLGSTEFILASGGIQSFQQKFSSMGTVRFDGRSFRTATRRRLASSATCRDWLRKFMQAEIEPELAPYQQAGSKDRRECN